MGLQQNLVECDEIGLFAERPQTAIGAVDHVIDKSAGSNTANARRQRIANRELSNVKGRVPFSYPRGIIRDYLRTIQRIQQILPLSVRMRNDP